MDLYNSTALHLVLLESCGTLDVDWLCLAAFAVFVCASPPVEFNIMVTHMQNLSSDAEPSKVMVSGVRQVLYS